MAIDSSNPAKGSAQGQLRRDPSTVAAAADGGTMTTPAASAMTPAAAAAVRRRPLTPASFRLEPDIARDLAPQVVLRVDEGARLFRRTGAFGEEADDSELLGDIRILQNLVQLLVHPRNDVGWGPGWRR